METLVCTLCFSRHAEGGERVPLDAGDPEYADVVARFAATCPNRTVRAVYRVCNTHREVQYHLEKTQMDRRGDGTGANEERLFHGTDAATCAKIVANGFNRSFSAVAAYGKGVYFAARASYSANPRYARPARDGVQSMFLARVLVGRFCVGTGNMVAPPPIAAGSPRVYDSMVDDAAHPSIYVGCHNDNRALPDYLIEFVSP